MNLSWINPKHVYVDEWHTKNVDRKRLSVGVMTATVTKSFLSMPVEGGPGSGPWILHRITIASFTQDIRWETSLWGLLFWLEDSWAPMDLVSPHKVRATETGQRHVCSFALTHTACVLISAQHFYKQQCPTQAFWKMCHLLWLWGMPARATMHIESSMKLVSYKYSSGPPLTRILHSMTAGLPMTSLHSCSLTMTLDASWLGHCTRKGRQRFLWMLLFQLDTLLALTWGENGLNILTNIQFVIVLAVPECV